jgi:hypothetical protein
MSLSVSRQPISFQSLFPPLDGLQNAANDVTSRSQLSGTRLWVTQRHCADSISLPSWSRIDEISDRLRETEEEKHQLNKQSNNMPSPPSHATTNRTIAALADIRGLL